MVLVLTLGLGTAAEAACPDATAAEAAFASRDAGALRDLVRSADVEPCPPGFRHWLWVALARISTAPFTVAPPAELTEAASPSGLGGLNLDIPLPLVLEALGDGYRQHGHYGAAAMAYQRAMTVLADRQRNWSHFNPGPAFVRAIHQKMEEARLLSPVYVPADVDPATMKQGGFVLGAVRGFNPKVRREPISFRTDSTELTPDGQRTVNLLLQRVLDENPDVVTVVGHADERGDETYNAALSERRAAAIADQLRAAGYKGNVTSIGKGEASPFPIDGRDALPQEDQWRLDRRVEICVGIATATCGG